MIRSGSSSAREARQRRIQKNANVVGYWIIGVAAAVVLMVVIAVALNNRSTTNVVPVAMPDVPAEWINGKSLGNPDAKVTIQMWEDFFCPACRQFTEVIEPQLMADYVIPGTVRLEYHHFPLQSHTPMAQQAAAASECAVEQGAFWPYHNQLFPAQARGQAGFTPEALIGYAEAIGLDGNAFRQCVGSQKYVGPVTESFNQALALGLNATPSLIINGNQFADPFDYNAMKAEIDGILAAN